MSTVNPFIVHSPEDLDAPEAHSLFVDVFTDFHKIRERGHTMVHGPRGCGKSMMFRYLEPDCQKLYHQAGLKELPFFAVLVPIKNTTLSVTELNRLRSHQANVLLNEHFLSMYVASRLFVTLSKMRIEENETHLAEVKEFAIFVMTLLRFAGLRNEVYAEAVAVSASIASIFEKLKRVFDDLFRMVVATVRSLTFGSSTELSYDGPICGHLDFLLPVFEQLKTLSFFPKGPIYLLMDDADYLNLTQTRVLNSWLATRTSAMASIKVSTQHKYKSFQTTSGMSVDAPHDFTEISISDRYTTSRGTYLARVRQIVEKRLDYAHYEKDPNKFFSADTDQEEQIRAIAAELKQNWHNKEGLGGNRPEDDSLRYARPIFMKQLKGPRKSLSSYSYAGFEQLVHISSGLVRYFLEPAARMFAEQQALNDHKPIQCIQPSVQNKIVREEADKLMLAEFEKVLLDEHEGADDEDEKKVIKGKKQKLYSLIRALGGVFHEKLLSDDSERRVFSVAFQDNPAPDVVEIFNLGVQFGYFHRSMIGNKDGTGRTPLYVLTRRLAPHFNLDPSGFAGYLFMNNERLREAMEDPDVFLRRVKSRGINEMFEERQLQLFE